MVCILILLFSFLLFLCSSSSFLCSISFLSFFPLKRGTIGTSVILEDVAVEVPKLAQMTLDLQKMFKKYEYAAFIFGHALSGNHHILFYQAFNSESEVKRYQVPSLFLFIPPNVSFDQFSIIFFQFICLFSLFLF